MLLLNSNVNVEMKRADDLCYCYFVLTSTTVMSIGSLSLTGIYNYGRFHQYHLSVFKYYDKPLCI